MGRLKEVRNFGAPMRVFFDVGANVGQTVLGIREVFPEVDIYTFEPSPGSFAELQIAVSEDTKVHAFNLALSDTIGSSAMQEVGTSVMNRLVGAEESGAAPVDMTTGDAFCESYGIDRIDYLKIDTEGHDLAVLNGFKSMIAQEQISFIEVEAGINITNTYHVDLTAFREFLEPQGYLLFGIYNQKKQRGKPFLRRINPVFLARRLYE